MQRLILAFAVAFLFACQSAPKAPEVKPVPPPVVAPKPPTEPFIALLEAKKDPGVFDVNGDDHVTRQEFKDHFLRAFSAADLLDGKSDGSVPIAESCKELLELCKTADADGNGTLEVKEFLDKVDDLFNQADRNHDGFLSRREIRALALKY
jgi:hypothetical protein